MLEGDVQILGRRFARRELALVAAAIVLGVAVRLVYAFATNGHTLRGDEPEYDLEGRFFAMGKYFWTTTPYGVPHASLFKAPGYPSWVGIWYALVGEQPDRLMKIQGLLLGPCTIVLSWLLARRLFGPRVATVAAFAVAVYPGTWQYEVRLYSESIATPLTLLVLLLFVERSPTPKRAALTGAAVGLSMLVRPSSAFLLAGVAVAWWLAAGPRRGTAMLAVTLAAAAALILPWTYHNHRVHGGFIPISIQDAAAYGTFNDDSAHDARFPYAWRPLPERDCDVLAQRSVVAKVLPPPCTGRPRLKPLGDVELHRRLIERTRDYIRDHPGSLPLAFFWNGLSRLWDVRRPSNAKYEIRFDGRTHNVAVVTLWMWWLLVLPLSLFALWHLRRRRALVLPVVALVLGASAAFTGDGGTRYRATLEPLAVVLACAGGTALIGRRHRYDPANA
jgi:4-amino-4-deoxy-L-arabinose transferase-like glycosyltransferase